MTDELTDAITSLRVSCEKLSEKVDAFADSIDSFVQYLTLIQETARRVALDDLKRSAPDDSAVHDL